MSKETRIGGTQQGNDKRQPRKRVRAKQEVNVGERKIVREKSLG